MSRAATLPLEETQHICRYWLHRISHEWDVSYKLLSAGYLSIGWSALAGSGIERVVRSATNSQPFEALMREYGYQASRSRWNLWTFCNFSRNDFVVVPLFNGEFSIYKVVGSCIPISELFGFPDFVSEDGSRIIRDEKGLLKIMFYVQVKLHDDITSQWAVEQIAMYKDQHELASGEYTIIPWVISTANGFSADAITMAQENNVRLITGTEFARLLIDAGITDMNKAFA